MAQKPTGIIYSMFLPFLILFLFFQGCASSLKSIGPDKQDSLSIRKPLIERGASLPPLDLLANLLALPTKLILWNSRYANHRISEKTEQAIADYIQRNELYDVKFRLNQFAPFDEMKRLFQNNRVGLPYRIIAIPFTFLYSAMGRLLGGLILSDYYDPFSHTVHIFSDDVAIALHEAGHAKDFHYHDWPGTYAMARLLPGFDTFQESIATDEAIDYLKSTGQRDEAVRAYKVLYPAYATYVGSYLPAYPIGYIGAVVGGHIFGRIEARRVEQELGKEEQREGFRETKKETTEENQ